MPRSGVLLASAAFLAASTVAPTAARADDDHRLLHVSLVIGGGLAYFASEAVFKEELAPSRCRWCDDNGLDRRVRDAVVWKRPQTADTISDLIAFGAIPALQLSLLAMAGRSDPDDDLEDDAWVSDGLAVAEAVVLAGLINQTAKFVVGRQRPYAHAAAPGGPAVVEDNLSFYSGHSTLGFALAAATGTVAQMRGYDAAPYIWATGVTLASTAAYLRLGGDRHWFSDVALGAAIGTAVGIAIPRLAHRHLSGDDALTVSAAPGLMLVSGHVLSSTAPDVAALVSGAALSHTHAMPTCRGCQDDVDKLVSVKVNGKVAKLCEDCADRAREDAEVAEASESVIQGMMGFKGRR